MKKLLLIMLWMSLVGTNSSIAQAPDKVNNIVCRTDLAWSALKQPGDRIFVAAHRGAHDIVPENSIYSLHRSLNLGVDIVEIDVRLSKDGVPILMHDKTIDRTTNGTGKVSDYTFEELQQFYLLFDGQKTSHKIPTLLEFLLIAKDRIIVDVDLKSDNVLPIIDAISEQGSFDNIMFFSSKLDVLSEVRAVVPEAVIMPLADSVKEAKYYATNFDIEVVHLKEKYATSQLTDFIRSSGSVSWLNTLGRIDNFISKGSSSAVDLTLELKPDILQTDKPLELLSILEGRGLRPNYYGLTAAEPCGVLTN